MRYEELYFNFLKAQYPSSTIIIVFHHLILYHAHFDHIKGRSLSEEAGLEDWLETGSSGPHQGEIPDMDGNAADSSAPPVAKVSEDDDIPDLDDLDLGPAEEDPSAMPRGEGEVRGQQRTGRM